MIVATGVASSRQTDSPHLNHFQESFQTTSGPSLFQFHSATLWVLAWEQPAHWQMEFSSHTSFFKLPISVLLGFSGFCWFSRDSAIQLSHSKVSSTCLGLMTHVVQNRKVCRTFSTSVSTCLPIAYNPIIANSSIARRDKLN